MFRATALLILAGGIAQAQNPPFYFVVRGRVANGDQFDPGWPFNFSTATGGGSTSRAIPNTSGYGNQNYTGWGTMTVSASIGAASLSATYQGNMDPVNASRGCGYYGCGWSPNADTQYSGIDVYVRGNPGTPYHIVQTDSGNLDVSVTKTTACERNNYANAQAHASWAGVNGSASASSENGPGGYCGVPVPKSGSAPVGLSYTRDGTSTSPTLTYNGQTYSYAYSAQTVIGLSIYAEQDPSFTAHTAGNVTVNVTGTLIRPNQTPPTAVIDPVGGVSQNVSVTLRGANSYATTPGASIVAYRWDIQRPGGTDVLSGSQVNYSWTTAGTYQVALTVTDSDGLTGSTSAAVTVTPPAPPLVLGCPASTATVYNSYASAFAVTGGTPPYSSYGIASGALPPGLSLSIAGNISGVPSATGQFSFVGTVSDSAGRPTTANCTITVSPSACTYTISPTTKRFSKDGGPSAVSVIASEASCVWSASSPVDWLLISGPLPMTGSGTVSYSVSPNTGQYRNTVVTVAGKPHFVEQLGAADQCGDERDDIILEYRHIPVYDIVNNWQQFIPKCSDFTQNYQMFNTGNSYSWLLVRTPLPSGTSRWIQAIGSPRPINSGYRTPAHNLAIGGARSGRHLFGDAVDLGVPGQTDAEWLNMKKKAQETFAEGSQIWIEPRNGPCQSACVHVDWRYTPGGYQR
jgi:hypothetical protein